MRQKPLCLAALLAVLCAPADPAAAQAAQIKPRQMVVCTPSTVQIGGGKVETQRNPIAYALTQCGPGSTIRLEPGTYPSFGIGFGHDKPWNARTPGGTRSQPITIFGTVGARIAAAENQGDTISISAGSSPGWITFQNITIVPGYRAAVIFYKGPPNTVYEGFRFHDCDILGSWDHLADRGGKSTWGVWAFGLKDFEFRGLRKRAVVSDLRKEHGFYLQNPKGDILIENVDGKRLGRTFLQVTARKSDGPAGVGTITVRNCRIEDVCIARTDDFKGGSALTFAGRLGGPIVLEKNLVRCGFDERFHRLTRKGVPYGTSALVFWDYGQGSNGPVVLRDNDFEFAAGCGDRPLVTLGGCQKVEVLAGNRFVSGGNQPALVLEPLSGSKQGKLQDTPNGPVLVEEGVTIEGGIARSGKPLNEAGRARLAVPLALRERSD